MQGGQQQAAPQQPHTQLGHSDLEKNLSDHHGMLTMSSSTLSVGPSPPLWEGQLYVMLSCLD